MTETPKSNGWQLGGKIVAALPAPFLMLCLINAVFIAALLWFLDARGKHTAELMDHLLTACVGKLAQ